jgi:hypothetical protein
VLRANAPCCFGRASARCTTLLRINKTLTLLAAVLDQAVEYEDIDIDRNPAAGKRRRLRVTRPARSYLDTAAQIVALLDAAGELDTQATTGHRHVHRRAMLATLTFAGLRLGELARAALARR